MVQKFLALIAIMAVAMCISTPAMAVPPTTAEVFAAMDTDHSGEVSLTEMEIYTLTYRVHDADQDGDGKISLDELLRVIQFYNTLGYHYCPDEHTEDGFCAGPSEGEGEGEQLPDLGISRLNVPQEPPVPGEDDFEAEFGATQIITTPFTIVWKMDEVTIKTKTITDLSGTLWIEGVKWLTPTTGTHVVSLTIDSGNVIAESNEANNTASFSFTITGGEGEGETDITPPVITVTGTNPTTVQCGGIYTEQGATAVDNVDGNVTATPSGSVDTTTPGAYTITYSATDFSNNVGSATRTVNVVDTTAPVITLVGNSNMSVNQGASFTDPGFTALDSCEGDVHSFVVIGGQTVDTSVAGTYTITYNVSDASGNAAAQVTRTVTVTALSGQAPEITTQPADQVKQVGQELLLRIIATDPQSNPLTYQWYKDGVLMVGQTTRDLRIDALDVMDEGIYKCIIRDNEGNETTSRDIVVDVNGKAWLRFTYEAGIGAIKGDLNLNGVTANSILAVGNAIAANEEVVGIQLTLWGGDGLFSERGLVTTPPPTNGWSEMMTYDGQGVVDGNGNSRSDVNIDTWIGNDLGDFAFFRVVVENTITGERRDILGNTSALVASLNGAALPIAPGSDGSWDFTVPGVTN